MMLERTKKQLMVILEEVMLAAPEVQEEAIQLYADLQVCRLPSLLYGLADATQKLLNNTNAARQVESETT